MASLPHETPQEDIRNAVAILQAAGAWRRDEHGPAAVTFSTRDYSAIIDRLTCAVAKLEQR